MTPRDMSEWQPIETAPKDGTRVMLSYSTGDGRFEWDIRPCRYDGVGWALSLNGEIGSPVFFRPTNWQPYTGSARMIAFVLTGDPVPWSRSGNDSRGGKIRHFTPRPMKAYQHALGRAGNIAMMGREMLTGSVVLRLDVVLAIPASWSAKKKERARAGFIRPDVKPDADNFLKQIGDALNNIVWDDDKRIVSATVDLWYGDSPGVRLEAEEWTGQRWLNSCSRRS